MNIINKYIKNSIMINTMYLELFMVGVQFF